MIIFGTLSFLMASLSRIEVRTDRLATPTRAGFRRCRWPRSCHAVCRLAADDVKMKTYYYYHQSVLIGRRSRYLCSTHFALTFDRDL